MPAVPAVASFRKKRKIIPGTYVFPTETRGDYDAFLDFLMACAAGGDTFSPLAPILGPAEKKWPCYPLLLFAWERM